MLNNVQISGFQGESPWLPGQRHLAVPPSFLPRNAPTTHWSNEPRCGRISEARRSVLQAPSINFVNPDHSIRCRERLAFFLFPNLKNCKFIVGCFIISMFAYVTWKLMTRVATTTTWKNLWSQPFRTIWGVLNLGDPQAPMGSRSKPWSHMVKFG